MSDTPAASVPTPPPFHLDTAISQLKRALRAERHATLDWLMQKPGYTATIDYMLSSKPEEERWSGFNSYAEVLAEKGMTQTQKQGVRRIIYQRLLAALEHEGFIPYDLPEAPEEVARKFGLTRAELNQELDEEITRRAPKIHVGEDRIEGWGGKVHRETLENAHLNPLERNYSQGVLKLASQILYKGTWKDTPRGPSWSVESMNTPLDPQSELFGALSQIVAACRFAELGGLQLKPMDFTPTEPYTAPPPPDTYYGVPHPHATGSHEVSFPAAPDGFQLSSSGSREHDQLHSSGIHPNGGPAGPAAPGIPAQAYEDSSEHPTPPDMAALPAAPPPSHGSSAERLTPLGAAALVVEPVVSAPSAESIPFSSDSQNRIPTPDGHATASGGHHPPPLMPRSSRYLDDTVTDPLGFVSWQAQKPQDENQLDLTIPAPHKLQNIRAAIERSWPQFIGIARAPG